MKVAIGSDHAGFQLKEYLKEYLKELKFSFDDFGTYSTDPVDYPDVVIKVAEAVAKGEYGRGITICGTGIGAVIVANKIPGIRASLCAGPVAAKFSRTHNNANVLAIGERLIGQEVAKEIVRVFLTYEFSGGRHQRRIDKISDLEKKYFKKFLSKS